MAPLMATLMVASFSLGLPSLTSAGYTYSSPPSPYHYSSPPPPVHYGSPVYKSPPIHKYTPPSPVYKAPPVYTSPVYKSPAIHKYPTRSPVYKSSSIYKSPPVHEYPSPSPIYKSPPVQKHLYPCPVYKSLPIHKHPYPSPVYKSPPVHNNAFWIVDTGVSYHLSSQLHLFTKKRQLRKPIMGRLLDGSTKHMPMVGDITVCSGIILKDVLYVKDFKYNLLSVSKLLEDSNLVALFTQKGFMLRDLTTRKIVVTGNKDSRLYKLKSRRCREEHSIFDLATTSPTSQTMTEETTPAHQPSPDEPISTSSNHEASQTVPLRRTIHTYPSPSLVDKSPPHYSSPHPIYQSPVVTQPKPLSPPYVYTFPPPPYGGY
ncbi:hypothetical protein Cgig2_018469 [Carnegiea gigantea]|uniref:Retrovirus-related Pol polyprotein from transposon TNT 1-94-like beta-barrel domain-containing protein n=1 Tax=Carnegiea gigantea TaxID=171969 RepID=A0A9Q1K9Z5_9CARY|nr:hypothetical protein Cgig2_018469 [Carnegiea gigantea]